MTTLITIYLTGLVICLIALCGDDEKVTYAEFMKAMGLIMVWPIGFAVEIARALRNQSKKPQP